MQRFTGRVVTGDTQEPVIGAVVEIGGRDVRSLRVLTDSHGDFEVEISGPVTTVEVFDPDTSYFAACVDNPTSGQIIYTQVSAAGVDDGQNPVIRADVIPTIRAAISGFSDHPEASLASFEQLLCGLPPIFEIGETVLGAAKGVLRGRGDDVLNFRRWIVDLKTWNRRAFGARDRALTAKEAEQVLSAEFLSEVPTLTDNDPAPVTTREAMLTMLAAAMRVAGTDPVIVSRNVGVIVEQFAGFDALASVYQAAGQALSGGAAERADFVSRIQLFAPICETPISPPRRAPLPGWPGPSPGPDDRPGWPGPFPRPGRPGWPGPFPGPDDRPAWPPGPGQVPIRPIDPCQAEAIPAVREFLRRRQQYTITSITPQGACPGTEIIITGTNLVFEGQGGVVRFPTHDRGEYVTATPVEWTDTRIRVVVPEGACDGILDLDIPAARATVVTCGVTIELFVSAETPITFVGGRTHIHTFEATGETRNCLSAGEVVHFYWQGCNIDSLRVVVTADHGTDLGTLTPTASAPRLIPGFVVPPLDRNHNITFRLEVSGPCGTDAKEASRSVRRALPLPIPNPFATPFGVGTFENFLGNIRRTGLLIAEMGRNPPRGLTALDRLLKAVEVTETAGQRLGTRGSGCSYTDIVVPAGTARMLTPKDLFVTDQELDSRLPEPKFELPPELSAVTGRALRSDLDDTHSVIPPAALQAYRDARSGGTLTPLRGRLIHFEAGIRMERLVCLLERLGLTMPTVGGGVPQSLSGAFSTGTHGSTVWLPPIADFIRAIHLVGPGGIQWWIEPASRRITDPDMMETLRRESSLDPCIRIRYDDDLFDAVLVSFGAAGVIYSVIVETIDKQVYRGRTTQPSWRHAQTTIRSTVLDTTDTSPWFYDITMDPRGRLRESVLELVDPETPLSEPDNHAFHHEIGEAILEVVVAMPARIGLAMPGYIARRSLEALLPWKVAEVFRDIAETVEMVAETFRLIADIIHLAESHFSDEALADALPNIVNLLWRVGHRIGVGKEIVDEIQNLVTEGERPAGRFVRQNHFALTWSDGGTCSSSGPLPRNSRPAWDPIDRLARSSEYIVPADQLIDFTEAIRDVAVDIRKGPDALLLVLNLRFTQQTQAVLGMQQHAQSGHLELFTFKGINGNEEFDRRIQPIIERFGAIPHWGQLHHQTTNYAALYGDSLDRWREALNEIADAAPTPNTFRHAFVRDRGLLPDR